MKKCLIFLFLPVPLAILSALAVMQIFGPTYTTAPNQDAMLFRLLWTVVFPLPLLVMPRLVYKAAPDRKWLMTLISFVVVMSSSFLNFLILTNMK
jgi:hypothetical protein